MRAAIEVRAIGQRTRSGAVTLRDVTLAVGHSELVGIIGGSGSGKGALLDAMSGLRPPSSGTVVRSAGTIGYVPKGDTIDPAVPLARALRYTARLRAVPRPRDAVADALHELGLSAMSGVPAGDLPGGERKRAAIAAELLAGPALFFLDEPTDGLDPARGRELMRTLRGLIDRRATVVLTTESPLDAERCDKVAVLATGGHLAFFGTPEAARGYFGADGLEEIFERLAGLSDPAEAWSRRFFQFYRTVNGISIPSVPPQRGSAPLVPDTAGPHSAGAPGPAVPPSRDPASADEPPDDDPAADPAADDPAGVADPAGAAGETADEGTERGAPGGMPAWVLRPVRQWAVLTTRNTDALLRARPLVAVLAGAPVVVLVASLLLFPSGAFDPAHPNPAGDVTILFWTVFGAFFIGLGYGLPLICTELGVLRRERFGGLGAGTYVLAKATVLLPVLAVADAIVLLVFSALGRLPEGLGFGAAFVTLLLTSLPAFVLGLLISAVVSRLPRAMIGGAAVSFPQVLFAGAILPLSAMVLAGRWISYLMPDRWGFDALGRGTDVRALWASGRSALGQPMLASYGTSFDRPVWGDWLILAAFTCVFLAATITAVATRTRVPARVEVPRIRR
ncbi:MAG TPA: ABC transporter permease [Streptosporangiaceae bacterium]|nr:ABC transporter permease [Streptosporangiaceae bacterium]